MPVLRIIDEGELRVIHGELFTNFANFGFDLLPFDVLIVKLLRQRVSALRIAREEKFDDGLGRVHTAGSIQTGGKLEGHLAGGGRGSAEACQVQKGSQARIAHLAKPRQAMLDDHAILAGEWNYIRNR